MDACDVSSVVCACDKAPKNMADLTDGRALIKDPPLKNPGRALAVPTIFFRFSFAIGPDCRLKEATNYLHIPKLSVQVGL